MAVHPKDRNAENPRMQCVCCGGWLRLHGKRADGLAIQRFYGGCEHNHGNDHLAGTADDRDVCNDCCMIECRRIASERVRTASGDWPDPGVEGGGIPTVQTV